MRPTGGGVGPRNGPAPRRSPHPATTTSDRLCLSEEEAAAVGDTCLAGRLDAFERPVWGTGPPPWAPGRREARSRMNQIARDGAVQDDRLAMLSEIDIFTDLSRVEMKAIAKAAPMRTYQAGTLLYSPHSPVEALFILKRGRTRIFRISPDGRALTTAIIERGTIFGEMVLLGQQMYDNYAEALDESLVCVMSRPDVHRFLLSDPRISARITEILGNRLAAMEQRLSDAVFKSVPQRIAATLCTLSAGGRLGRSPLSLTHEQVAALVGTSRETATKALGDFSEQGLVRLGRGKITVLDRPRLAAEAGHPW